MLKNLKILIALLLITAFIQQGCKPEDDVVLPVIPEAGTGMWYVGKLITGGDALCVRGYTINKIQYAFLADGPKGLDIINVTDGANPVLVSNFATGGSASEIFLDSLNGHQYAFLSDTVKGIFIIDVTNPANPVLDTNISYAGVTSSSRKDSALFAASNSGIKILNIKNLPSVNEIGSYANANPVRHIEISGSVCYLVENITGLEIVNITNPASPVQYTTFRTPGSCYDIKIADNLGYVADGLSGISVISVSNPSQPYFIRTKSTDSDVRKLDYSPNFLFSAENTYGAEVFNLFDPAKPDMVGYFEPKGNSNSIHFYKAKVLIAHGTEGLLILRF
ncbi:MAG: hypothetical protein PHN88_14180 [Ignavibacteria bacterium]|nr:hypothetical protein [Ignavibacteria bacterium]